MFGATSVFIVCAVFMKLSDSTSVPIYCQNVQCEAGSVCTVVPDDSCVSEPCSDYVGQCVPVSTKDGDCPIPADTPSCYSFRGVPECLIDDHCARAHKCCDGCCRAPVATPVVIEPQKSGMCPDLDDSIEALRLLVSDFYCRIKKNVGKCVTDYDCAGLRKCCKSLCGSECKPAISIAGGSRAQRAGDEHEKIVVDPRRRSS